jgi:DNA-binding MarR family transcriptional regulator
VQAEDIFHKTSKGHEEIETRSAGLTMKQRRVLILVNGANDINELGRLSLCDDVAAILQRLAEMGLIDSGSSTTTTTTTTAIEARDHAIKEKSAALDHVGAGEFMCNTLLTFANRVRVGKLIEEIQAAGDKESIGALIKPWYQAISETPGGMYQADELRDQVNKMLE